MLHKTIAGSISCINFLISSWKTIFRIGRMKTLHKERCRCWECRQNSLFILYSYMYSVEIATGYMTAKKMCFLNSPRSVSAHVFLSNPIQRSFCKRPLRQYLGVLRVCVVLLAKQQTTSNNAHIIICLDVKPPLPQHYYSLPPYTPGEIKKRGPMLLSS
jgi:hypothetical protein